MITVWIFVSTILLFDKPVDLATGQEYAFLRKEACEAAIVNTKSLRCIELRIIK